MNIPALIVYSPAIPLCRGIAGSLSDELLWRGFEPAVRAGRDLDASAVAQARLLVLVFPVLPLAWFPSVALGGMPAVVRSMGSLQGKAVAALAVSPLPLRSIADAVTRQVQRAGGQVVTADSVPPLGPRGAIVDLAAECMVRITR